MANVGLYTFGLLDPAMGPTAMAAFAKRGSEIFGASNDAPGFLGRPEGEATQVQGESFGEWGRYVLPLGLPDFAGHDPHVHIATLSLWRDVESARRFVYGGLHREALTRRYDWFLKGPWPGHVLWRVGDGGVPTWSDGVRRLEALAAVGESADRFTFGSNYSR